MHSNRLRYPATLLSCDCIICLICSHQDILLKTSSSPQLARDVKTNVQAECSNFTIFCSCRVGTHKSRRSFALKSPEQSDNFSEAVESIQKFDYFPSFFPPKRLPTI